MNWDAISAIAESTENLGSDLISNGEIAEIFVKHLSGKELSPVENLRLQARCYRDMQHWENIHYQFNEGLVSEDQWEGFRKNLVTLLAIDAYREYWEHESLHYSDAFQAEIASLLKEPRNGEVSASITARFRDTNGRYWPKAAGREQQIKLSPHLTISRLIERNRLQRAGP